MDIKKLQAVVLVVTSVFACGIANAQTAVTVIGQSDPALDVAAVQTAVDSFDVVTLSGTFNFGEGQYPTTPAGTVFITRHDVVLQGPATIVGGGSPSQRFNIWPVIDVSAPGATVRNLTLVDFIDTGIYINGGVDPTLVPMGVIVQGNTITAEWAGVVIDLYTLRGADLIRVQENIIFSREMGIFLWGTGGVPIEVRDNTIAADVTGINGQWTGHIFDWANYQTFEGMSPVDIVSNDIVFGGGENPYGFADGINIWGWHVSAYNQFRPPNLPPETDFAEWGDNGPVTISENVLTCAPEIPGQWTSAINIGRSAQGLNHSLVINNTIRGECTSGITKFPYGGDNAIIGNDLSDLTTRAWQMEVEAHDTTVADNIFGAVVNPPALRMLSINRHPPFTPMPRPIENCVILDNDYRGTGLPGWSQWRGAIGIASDAELGWGTGVGAEVRNNLISESGRFPEGTGGAKKQILEMIEELNPLVHDNRIVGLPANHTTDPGIGQKMKDARYEAMLSDIGEMEDQK